MTTDDKIANLDAFTRAYLECALWSSTDNADESGGEPLDANYSLEDMSVESLDAAIKDCAAFQESNASALRDAYGARNRYDEESAGHDFWLTRNGHGAGFWDRGLGEVGDELSKASKPYGSVDLYVGDDGKIYGG